MGSRFLRIFFIALSISLFSEEAPHEISLTPRPRSVKKSPATPVAAKPCPRPCPAPIPQVEDDCFHSRLQIGADYTYAHITPHGNASSSGNLGGLQALYEFRSSNWVYGGLTFAWKQGNTDGSEGNRSLLMFDVEERIGGCVNHWQERLDLILFTGFGYRHYGEKVSGLGSSLRFNYNEFYVPVGFLFNGKVSSSFGIGLNAQWMPQVYPTVTIVPLKGARWIISNELANFRIEVPLTIVMSCRNHLTLIIQPFFEYWRDGHTTAHTELGTALNVPGNTYLFGGVDLNIRYSF